MPVKAGAVAEMDGDERRLAAESATRLDFYESVAYFVRVLARRLPEGCMVEYVNNKGRVRKVPLRLQWRNHSPDGFNWGYAGSGPAQLALGILSLFWPKAQAMRHYQKFKLGVIAGLEGDAWIMPGEDVRNWMEKAQGSVVMSRQQEKKYLCDELMEHANRGHAAVLEERLKAGEHLVYYDEHGNYVQKSPDGTIKILKTHEEQSNSVGNTSLHFKERAIMTRSNNVSQQSLNKPEAQAVSPALAMNKPAEESQTISPGLQEWLEKAVAGHKRMNEDEAYRMEITKKGW